MHPPLLSQKAIKTIAWHLAKPIKNKNRQPVVRKLLGDFNQVIPKGFEPLTHGLEGRCSNPTELRNHQLAGNE